MISEDENASQPLEDAAVDAWWEPPSPDVLQALLQNFEVLELIGRGGMGAVYRARQVSLDRMVAIKLLGPNWHSNADYADRFRQEARMMARLTHPGIVAVFDFGETVDGQLYFVMEYVQGIDVAHMLIGQGKLQPLHALSIAAHVCDTLRYAHEHGIIHRDIKPANVMVDMEGRVKVADFGLASLAAQEDAEDGTTMGTPDYVAPESLVIGMSVDHRADLFSVGVMLHEMLTGQLPRTSGLSPSAAVPGLDVRFDAIVKHALEPDPSARYQSAAVFRQDLDRILSVPVAATVPAPQYRRPMNARAKPRPTTGKIPVKNDTSWAVILSVGVALTVGAYFFLKNSPKQSLHASLVEAVVPKSDQRNSHALEVPVAQKRTAVPETFPPPFIGVSETTPVPTEQTISETRPPTFVGVPEPGPSGGSPPEITAIPMEKTISETPPSVVFGREPDADNNPKNATALHPRLKSLCDKFTADMEREIATKFEKGFNDLDIKYSEALEKERLIANATDDKQLQTKLHIEEKNAAAHRLKQPKNVEKNLPEPLKRLRETYWSSVEKLASDRNRFAEALCEKHRKALSALSTEFHRTGWRKEADEVDAKIREVKEMHFPSGRDFP